MTILIASPVAYGVALNLVSEIKAKIIGASRGVAGVEEVEITVRERFDNVGREELLKGAEKMFVKKDFKGAGLLTIAKW